jgi:PmbA protein
MLSGNVFNALKHASASSIKTRQVGPFILPQIVVSKLRVVG